MLPGGSRAHDPHDLEMFPGLDVLFVFVVAFMSLLMFSVLPVPTIESTGDERLLAVFSLFCSRHPPGFQVKHNCEGKPCMYLIRIYIYILYIS